MKNIEEKIIDYLDGNLTDPSEIIAVENYLNQHEIDFLEMKATAQKLENLPIPEPSPQMRNQFYANLSEWKKSEATENPSLVHKLDAYWAALLQNQLFTRLLFSICLFLGGIWVGTQVDSSHSNQKIETMASEMQKMQKVMMLSLIEQNSASKRIQAVNMAETLINTDDKILDVLFHTLNKDSNVNVRIVTAETLAQFISMPTVRTQLIQSLSLQESPLVQLTIVDVLLKVNNHEAKDAMKKLLEDEKVNEAIKEKVRAGLQLNL